MKKIILTTILIAGLFNLAVVRAQSSNKAAIIDYHQTAKTKFVEANGTRYAYRVLGNKTGIPLVLLPGSFSNMDEWDPSVTNGLAQQYKVILFDNKGVGATNGKTPDNIADMAKDAVVFIKALGYSKVNLVGWSMGGMITQQILLTEPQLVNKIILIGTGAKGAQGLSEVGARVTEVSKLSPPEQLLHLLFAPSDNSQQLGKLALGRMFKRQVDRDPETTNETNIAQITAVVGWAQPNTGAFDELKSIKQPALIVAGRYDILIPVVNAFNLYQNLPNAQLSLYPDAGHGVILQYPDQFLQEAISFLASK
jgi:pimeloyl-ACP methyl ester carboxylesterase